MANAVNICNDCSVERNICKICGNPMDTSEEDVKVSNSLRASITKGQECLAKFFKLSDKELKTKLSQSFPESRYKDLLSYTSSVTRTIQNGVPDSIRISWYDAIEITWSGIHYIPEHGEHVKIDAFVSISIGGVDL